MICNNCEEGRIPLGEHFVSLDMAIDTVWTLYNIIIITKETCKDKNKISKLITMKSKVLKAKSQASELRYLTEVMNHEKY